MSSSLWLVHIVIVSYIPAYIPAKDFSSLQSFEDAINILSEVCTRPVLCGGEFDYEKSSCCGACMCMEENCLETGSCCLYMYDSLSHLTSVEQTKRSSCLLSQYLPYKDTQFSTDTAFTFVSACDRENATDNDRYLCETPGSDLNDLEAIVPVTEPVSNIQYKNRYCAYCNNVHKSDQLIDWKLRINNNQHISFPRNDLLEEIKKTRGNIMFIPPVSYFEYQECQINSIYTIERCNQTGLWEKHNSFVEVACESSYTDAYNYTYKNFFCFLCNAEQSVIEEDWLSCGSEPSPNKPGFSAVYDLKVIMDGPNTDRLVCNATQFADKEMRVCRNIFCYDYHVLDLWMCSPTVYAPFSPACVSVFMKLSPLQLGTKLNLSDKKVFKRKIQNEIFSEAAQNVKLFFKTNDEGYNEYVVVFIETFFETTESIDSFLEDVIRLTESDMSFGTDLNYSAEMALYKVIVSDQTIKLLVQNTEGSSFDELIEDFTPVEESLCLHKERISLNKLFNCPYIKLSLGEIPMRIELDFLLILDKFANTIIKKLSRWQYERQDDTIKICFKDYIIIKNAMATSQTYTTSSSDSLTWRVCFIWYAFVCMCHLYCLFLRTE